MPRRLSDLAGANDIPLIVDNAYGAPFPDILFEEVKPDWNENTIFCMSLSKLGLPAARTGIVIAGADVIEMVSKVNAVLSLAPGGIGPAIAANMVRTGEIISLSRDVIKPFYQNKAQAVLKQVFKELGGIDFHVHKPQGAFFLWLWFPGQPITCAELYQRLKNRGVMVIPGHYFFGGLKEEWRHKNECIRVNYSQESAIVSAGVKAIAEEVKEAYRNTTWQWCCEIRQLWCRYRMSVGQYRCGRNLELSKPEFPKTKGQITLDADCYSTANIAGGSISCWRQADRRLSIMLQGPQFLR